MIEDWCKFETMWLLPVMGASIPWEQSVEESLLWILVKWNFLIILVYLHTSFSHSCGLLNCLLNNFSGLFPFWQVSSFFLTEHDFGFQIPDDIKLKQKKQNNYSIENQDIEIWLFRPNGIKSKFLNLVLLYFPLLYVGKRKEVLVMQFLYPPNMVQSNMRKNFLLFNRAKAFQIIVCRKSKKVFVNLFLCDIGKVKFFLHCQPKFGHLKLYDLFYTKNVLFCSEEY